MAVSTQNRGAEHCQLPAGGSSKGRNSRSHSWAELGTLHLSWATLGVTAMPRFGKQILLPRVLLQPFAPVLRKLSWHVIFQLEKIYFAWFLLQFACALLAPHSVARVTGTCSKGRIYIVWFSVQIWFCSCWAKILMLDSSGRNAWTHSILIFFLKDLQNALKWCINTEY